MKIKGVVLYFEEPLEYPKLVEKMDVIEATFGYKSAMTSQFIVDREPISKSIELEKFKTEVEDELRAIQK